MWPFHDYGGSGPTIVALHGHFGTSQTFRPLAAALGGRLRVVAPDQRGHGSAPSGGTPGPASYLEPIERFVDRRTTAPAIVYGHSMGGTHAVLLAARRPDLVGALIIEDAPVDVPPSVLDQSTWPRRAPTFMELAAALQSEGIDDPSYFMLGAVRYLVQSNSYARLCEFESCGHWIHDDDPRGVAEAVESFVRGLDL